MKVLFIGNGHSLTDFKRAEERARNGGETKLIYTLKVWHEFGVKTWILCPDISKEIFTRAGVKSKFITLGPKYNHSCLGFVFTLFKRIIGSIHLSIPDDFNLIYASSDFLFDLIPAIWAKKKNPQAKLLTCLYLIAPPPWRGYKNMFTNRINMPTFKGLLYYFSQKISISLIRHYADIAQVFNDFDKEYLISKNVKAEKIKVIKGGVDKKYVAEFNATSKNLYDCVFLGRLQPQKGFMDLIDIWDKVCQKNKKAKLALIGGGSKQAFKKIHAKIRDNGLEENIKVWGFLKGDQIFTLLKSSNVFLCPSKYESWGIVVIEAMACGLPVIAYDLPVFRALFYQGMVRVPVGDIDLFSNQVIKLLEDDNLRQKLSGQASEISDSYDWNNVASDELTDLKCMIKADR